MPLSAPAFLPPSFPDGLYGLPSAVTSSSGGGSSLNICCAPGGDDESDVDEKRGAHASETTSCAGAGVGSSCVVVRKLSLSVSTIPGLLLALV